MVRDALYYLPKLKELLSAEIFDKLTEKQLLFFINDAMMDIIEYPKVNGEEDHQQYLTLLYYGLKCILSQQGYIDIGGIVNSQSVDDFSIGYDSTSVYGKGFKENTNSPCAIYNYYKQQYYLQAGLLSNMIFVKGRSCL